MGQADARGIRLIAEDVVERSKKDIRVDVNILTWRPYYVIRLGCNDEQLGEVNDDLQRID